MTKPTKDNVIDLAKIRSAKKIKALHDAVKKKKPLKNDVRLSSLNVSFAGIGLGGKSSAKDSVRILVRAEDVANRPLLCAIEMSPRQWVEIMREATDHIHALRRARQKRKLKQP